MCGPSTSSPGTLRPGRAQRMRRPGRPARTTPLSLSTTSSGCWAATTAKTISTTYGNRPTALPGPSPWWAWYRAGPRGPLMNASSTMARSGCSAATTAARISTMCGPTTSSPRYPLPGVRRRARRPGRRARNSRPSSTTVKCGCSADLTRTMCGRSANGTEWRLALAAAPWLPRWEHTAVVYTGTGGNGTIAVLGRTR